MVPIVVGDSPPALQASRIEEIKAIVVAAVVQVYLVVALGASPVAAFLDNDLNAA